jgi:tRNA A37 threonylcarbamoyladenosine biosynthesis protein TsaE
MQNCLVTWCPTFELVQHVTVLVIIHLDIYNLMLWNTEYGIMKSFRHITYIFSYSCWPLL